jgi:hypothetical protein
MTCQECQPLAIDLARGLPPFDIGGAVQRGDVLSHIARCKRCAQWLAEQEALSEALRAAAEADASLSAPPSVEANVMAAWRARQPQRQVAGSRSSLGSPASLGEAASLRGPVRTWRPSWPAWPASGFAAAAAVVVLTLTLGSMRWLNAPSDAGSIAHQSGTVSTGAAGPSATVAGPSADTANGSTRGAVTGTNAAVVEVLPEKGSKGSKGRPVPPRVTAQGSAVRAVRASRGGNAVRAANELSGPAFVLLPYVEPLRPTEMRHIMRVRMSRAQVAAGEIQAGGLDGATVLADVLVGEDGTARAVRIVQ